MISTPEAVSILEWKAEQIEKLLEGTHPAPWVADKYRHVEAPYSDTSVEFTKMFGGATNSESIAEYEDYDAKFKRQEDASFIAASRTLVPQMREMIRGALKEWKKDAHGDKDYEDSEEWQWGNDAGRVNMLLSLASPFEAEWRALSTKGRE